MKETKQKNQHAHREPWIGDGVIRAWAPHFKEGGYTIPENVKGTFSFSMRGRTSKNTFGEVIPPDVSEDAHWEITVPLNQDDPDFIIRAVGHSLVHVVSSEKHDAEFAKAVNRLRFDIPAEGLKAALPGHALDHVVAAILDQAGPLPHKKMDYAKLIRVIDRPKSQQGRNPMKKAVCMIQVEGKPCDYTIRAARGTLERGIPACPVHQVTLTVELKEGEDPIADPADENGSKSETATPINETQEAAE